MATLSAMVLLFDGYTTTIDAVNKKTDEASEKILNASGSTDTLNKKLEASGASAKDALGQIGGLVGILSKVGKAVTSLVPDEVMEEIGSKVQKAFAPVKNKMSELFNTDGFQQFIDVLIIGFNIVAKAAVWLIDSIINGWSIIGPMLAFVGTVLLAGILTSLWGMLPPILAMIPSILASAAAWLVAAWPLTLIIGIIVLVITAITSLGGTWEEIFGVIGGIVGTFVGHFYNGFVYIWNAVAAFINFFGNVFSNPIASVQTLFYDLMVNVLGFIETMAQGIEDLLNKIPGVKVDITSNITGLKNKFAAESANIKSEADLKEFVKTKEFMDYSVAYTKGSDTGKNVANKIGDGISSLTDKMTGAGEADLSGDGSRREPKTVQGTGINGAVKVDMSDEDLQYLKDVAERDYVAKIASNTLAPNISITFGDVHETADADKVAGRINKILQEEISMSGEGVYD
ncbi:MAG: hypothetical protein CVV02_15195 [Firmicutes bacterium HGW-Firmicutes-7]|nr:MAG: hypothetical protein CVV02_15195 [Firmicutes bacterium HGW-Firmicutes-7]